MGAQQTISWNFPSKGWITTQPFGQQPDGSTPDCLNWMPFDPNTGRARGGMRSGTSKLYAAAIGGGTKPISYLGQMTIALDPASITADTLLLDEPFTYTDGDLEVKNATWRTSATNSAGSGVVAAGSGNRVLVDTNQVKGNVADWACAAVWNAALVVGLTYILRATVTPSGVAAGYGINLIARINKTTWDTTHVYLNLSRARIAICKGVGGIETVFASYTFPTYITAAPHILEFRIAGDVLQGWLDGALVVSTTNTFGNANSGVGLAIRCSAVSVERIDDFKVYTGKNLANYRETSLVAVCGADIYRGDLVSMAIAGNGTGQLSDQVRAQVCYADNKAYFVDGFNIRMLNLATRFVETYAATAGTAPLYCTLSCMWHGRLVLAAPRDNPQNWYMTRIGVPTDHDYGQVDTARAIAGNGSAVFGKIGDPIVALIPFSDDVLIFLGDHNMHQLTGDPASGGNLDVLSDSIGGLGPNCWAKDPAGVIYFVGTGGFYRLQPGQPPVNISSERINEFFRSIDRGLNYIQCAWDRDRHGCWVFITPVNTGTAYHVWYDERADSFWPVSFPNTHGPMTALVYDGDAAADRALFMGGRTGLIQKLDGTAVLDDATTISAYLWLGPIRPIDDSNEAKTYGLSAFLGQEDAGFTYNLVWLLHAAPNAYKALTAPVMTATGTYTTAGWQALTRVRLRGGCFAMKISNAVASKRASFERFILTIDRGAGQR